MRSQRPAFDSSPRHGTTPWVLVQLVFLSLGIQALHAALPERVDFNFHVRPLLSDRCFLCHGPDERGRKAKLRLDTREGLAARTSSGLPVVAPRDRAQSDLWRRIVTNDKDERMPPTEGHLRLTPDEIEILGRWIDQGAEHKQHWAFLPVPAGQPPERLRTGWGLNDIDAFVQKKHQELGLQHAPETTREQWLRRVSFDLTGLPPSLEELDAFTTSTATNAYEREIARLLASPAYGERMASEWLDLARYADTYGYQADVDRDMSAWRDWVIRSLNQNLPWDQFLLWQLAGDLLPNATHEQQLATAFNRLHRQTNEGGGIDEEFRNEYVSDRVHTVGTALLGLALECARCHDHKFDPVSQRDYYRLSAFFNNIDESGLYSHFTRATPTPTLTLYQKDQEARHHALRKAIVDAEQSLLNARHSSTGRFEGWLKSGPATPALPAPVAHFSFDTLVSNRFPSHVGNFNATPVENPSSVPGKRGNALKFNGDNSVQCRGVGHFGRTDPFSLSFWLRQTELQPRAVILHHSRAWSDSGSRGYEVLLKSGRPHFALIHFWPGNAIAIRAKQTIPTNEWTWITATYDGSSRADGLHLFMNGRPMEIEVVRDNLYRDIQHRSDWGDADAGSIELTLAGRFRDSGFKNGELDELQIFDLCLTPGEIRRMGGEPTPSETPTFEDYVERVDGACKSASVALGKARREENNFISGIQEIMTMKELEKRRQTYVLRRGAYDAPGEPVDPGVPERLMPMPSEYPRNRLGFARWAIDRRNPLTARVAVNRIWKLHFGRGLVASSDDFGAQGQLPTHPELLDWLTGRFMDSGWDRKALHALIVSSATYRQSSQASVEALSADPDNRWLARGPKHRLQAEQIRDQALAVSGLLVKQIGGPSVKPYQPAGVWEDSGTGKSYTPDKGEKLYRRSLYTFWRRTAPPPSMLSFDAPSREVCSAKREVTSTPLQALVMLNDVQYLEAARVLAQGLMQRHPGNLDAQIDEAFRRITSRRPDAREKAVLTSLHHAQLEFYARNPEKAGKLLTLGESAHDAALPATELAATAMLVSTLMNHDDFVMKR